ncbi:MAG: hypothetical protein FJW31_21040 [Acidobacteria bacterium]|nr:hypothetical protein [Acidobacteriota bacterium]
MSITELGVRVLGAALVGAIKRAGERPHAASGQVTRRKLPYWQERGWERDGEHYRGKFQTDYGAFIGHVQRRSSKHYEVFILEPPMEQIKKHKHSSCFQPRNQGWWHVHLSRHPQDASSAIMAVEQVITEAYEQ